MGCRSFHGVFLQSENTTVIAKAMTVDRGHRRLSGKTKIGRVNVFGRMFSKQEANNLRRSYHKLYSTSSQQGLCHDIYVTSLVITWSFNKHGMVSEVVDSNTV